MAKSIHPNHARMEPLQGCASGEISSQRGTFDMSPSISGNIYIISHSPLLGMYWGEGKEKGSNTPMQLPSLLI
jgi:hypothetical protein